MLVDHQCCGDLVVSCLVGELDTGDAHDVWEDILGVLELHPRGVVLDFSQCTYVASAGISLILRLAQHLRGQKVPLRMAGLSEQLKTLFDEVKLTAAVPTDLTVDDALNRLRQVTERASVV